MIRAGERSVECLNDPHTATATRTGRRVVIGCTALLVIVAIGFRRSGRYFKELSTQHELVGAMAVGGQAIVANAMEAVGQHMEQEPTRELARVKPHDLAFMLAVLPIILPAKADVIVVDFEEATVGDGDAV